MDIRSTSNRSEAPPNRRTTICRWLPSEYIFGPTAVSVLRKPRTLASNGKFPTGVLKPTCVLFIAKPLTSGGKRVPTASAPKCLRLPNLMRSSRARITVLSADRNGGSLISDPLYAVIRTGFERRESEDQLKPLWNRVCSSVFRWGKGSTAGSCT
jgi:hypothetical protein